ncbi:MAG: TonB family protein [Opitutaceae bacterium]|nr:TonB family protein [Opitutaceae bacterium]
MNTRFLIPATVALAIHGGLFFGFPKAERASIPLVEEPSRPPFVYIPLDLVESPIVVVVCDGSPTISPPPAPRPVGAEPLPVEVGERISIELPPIRATEIGDVREIVPFEFLAGDSRPGAKWRDGIIPGGVLDNPPRTRFQVSPVYPFEERKRGEPGEVWVEFNVDESGNVHDARVTKSSNRAFEDPTLRAVAKWRFEPGKRHGVVVPFRMTVPVIFSLNE